ncbi:FRG domain-containing protein [Alkaliphilus crotonatoxidans]
MKTYKAQSISEYLSILEGKGISEYIYRGQNEPYFSIKASGFRPYLGGWNSDKIYDMEYLHSAFYNRIIGQVSEHEKKYFLAFCQHHGIPTNLVDMSYSPLVALFFACDGKTEQKFSLQEFLGSSTLEELENDSSLQKMLIHNILNQARKPFHSPYAQTYVLKKQRLINITNIIIMLQGKSLFEELLTDYDIALALANSIHSHFRSVDITSLKDWTKNLLINYCNINEVYEEEDACTIELYKKIKSLLSKSEDINIQDYHDLLQVISESDIENGIISALLKNTELLCGINDCDIIALLYMILLVATLYELKNYPRKININLDIYFTYQPPELFGRISSQQSFFIYQPYIYTNDGVYNYCELNVQEIVPDILIEIDNYSNILQELNLLGIDNGTIYGDIDNIAKALLKSGKLLKV